MKQKLGLHSKEKCRRHPLWLSRHFDSAMRLNSCFRGSVVLCQRAFQGIILRNQVGSTFLPPQQISYLAAPFGGCLFLCRKKCRYFGGAKKRRL
ncbi:MAG: hypothetical protein ACLVEL_08635 [Ruthenibacterium sp.]